MLESMKPPRVLQHSSILPKKYLHLHVGFISRLTSPSPLPGHYLPQWRINFPRREDEHIRFSIYGLPYTGSSFCVSSSRIYRHWLNGKSATRASRICRSAHYNAGSFHSKFHSHSTTRQGRYHCAVEGGETGEGCSECVDVGSSDAEGSALLRYEQLLSVDQNARENVNGITDGPNPVEAESTNQFIVVTFYHFVEIEDPHQEVASHTAFMQGQDLRGRIYINHQGINAQLSGQRADAMAYAEWVKEDDRFSSMLVQVSPSPQGHSFPRLKLRYKPSLVQVEGGTGRLPITDPSVRAVPLTPQQWREKLEAEAVVDTGDESGKAGIQRLKRVLLLDVRNGYEWDVGHFHGAHRPEVDCFRSTEFGLSEEKNEIEDPLAGVDKEAVDVMMYCTGGIRCDVYSTMLRQKGFKNLFTLKGGISHYLKEEGASKWVGNLFVFDSRLAVSPKLYHHGEASLSPAMSEDGNNAGTETGGELALLAEPTFARCRLCGDQVPEALHRNCANLDCNELYLSCPECMGQHKGCCCSECAEAPRLRPLLESKEPYKRWHNYRPSPTPPPRPPGYISRRALKRQNRRERRRQRLLEESEEGGEVVRPQLLSSGASLD